MALSSLSTIAFYLFIIHLIPCATPLSFNFSKISDYQNKIILGNNNSDFSSSQGLQLTPNDVGTDRHMRGGRAIYKNPLHLWDTTSGDMVDFTTTFSFVIDSYGSSDYGDGITFFLAENNSDIRTDRTLGLPVEDHGISTAQFVAVEFDTYGEDVWDPFGPDTSFLSIGEHVGIDISSPHSIAYTKWFTNIPLGREYEATISYHTNSKDLSVVFTGYQNDTRVQQNALHHTVDLRKELPEWVIFGFTASTGDRIQKNNVKSWSFKSTKLHLNNHL